MEYEGDIKVARAVLVGLVGQRVTWATLAELGIESPHTPAQKPTVAAYRPCLRCKIVLGNYCKGFCHPCYRKEKNKLVDLQGRELHPHYHTPPCSTCGKADARTYQIPQTEQWFCLDHDTTAKRQAYVSDKIDTNV